MSKLIFFAAFLFFSFNSYAFPQDFLFGVANAPGHVEDHLDDVWMDFAKDGKIRAFDNQVSPQKRLEFWTKPEIEIGLAAELGVKIFRLGVDWGRIQSGPDQYDENAIKHYRKIFQLIKAHKIKIMATLFHFSVPKWVQATGGWKNPENIKYFVHFSQKMISEFNLDVDYWLTVNEPQVFSMMAYVAGVFPPGEKGSILSLLNLGFYKGEAYVSLENMASAHTEIYDWAHEKFKDIKIGIAQQIGYHQGSNILFSMFSKFTGPTMNWTFPDLIKNKMDFFGFNYYGAEWVGLGTVRIEPNEEYSEAGRAISPTGLYIMMKQIYDRYRLPLFITENGVSDDTDIIRPSYLLEHLSAVEKSISEDVPVLGYIHWTLTDNMEWADGYCPKFGLMAVDRNSMARIKRESFNLYQKIIHENVIQKEDRAGFWLKVQNHVGKDRPFCRSEDGFSGLDTPVVRKFIAKDWRFLDLKQEN